MSSRSKKAKALTKTQFASAVADKAGVEKKTVMAVLDAMEDVTKRELKTKGVASPLPGLIKATVQHKKPTPARQGRNPRTGETVTIPPKPARRVVRVRALKRLKEVV